MRSMRPTRTCRSVRAPPSANLLAKVAAPVPSLCAHDVPTMAEAADERRRAEELRRELDGLAMQEGKLPPEQQRLRSQLEQQAALVQSREAACNELLSSKNLKLSELHKGAVLYSARLGLTFERVGDERLRLIFTNVDERSPAREFSFQVRGGALKPTERCGREGSVGERGRKREESERRCE